MTRRAGSDRTTRPAGGARLLSDERLAQRAAKGDERAFAAIYQRYSQSLYRFCFSVVGNPEDACDALQNTMVKALQALPGEERQIQLKPWLYRVARNESVELLRKRRDTVEFADDLAAPSGEPAETAAQRERLRQLLRDLAELPERQRSMLTMRELSGLGFDQIGEAFGTSPAVVRQTIYEARLSLRQLAKGREMSCDEVMRRLSAADGRVRRRRDIQAHLRACPDCRMFAQAIEERRHDLAALAPLPAIASAGILHAVLGGGHGAVSGATAGTTVAAGAGKAAATSVLVKSVATVAVVATAGISAADRGGLVDVGLPGGNTGTAIREAGPAGIADPTGAGNATENASQVLSRSHPGGKQPGSERGQGTQAGANGPSTAGSTGHGAPPALPQASDHGQQAATEHKAGPSSHRSKAHHLGSARSHGANAHSHRGASHAHSGAGKSHKGSAGAGQANHAPPDNGKQGATQSPPTDPATSGTTEPAAPLGKKSNANSTP